MDWMDGPRRLGGLLWVAVGVIVVGYVEVTQGIAPGPITTVVSVVVLALAVSTLAGIRRLVVVLGWVTSVGLGVDFLGAVADRFGLLGSPGTPGVWWGSWAAFTGNVTEMLHGLDGWVAQVTAIGATAAEVVLGLALVTGWQRRWVGKAAAGLLGVYLVVMAASVGVGEVARFALPILIGGALLVSAAPRTLRASSSVAADDRRSAAGTRSR